MNKTCLFVCLLFLSDLARAQGPVDAGGEEKRARPAYSLGVAASHSGNFRLSNVPERVRAVPLHRNDGHLSGHPSATRPIVDDELDPFTIATLGLEVRGEYRWLEIGGRFSVAGAVGDRVQQNQFGGTDRGSGTSLRFYEVSSHPLSTVLFGGVRVPLVRPRNNWRGMRLALGGEYDPLGTSIRFRTGWDRFNDDQVWRRFKIGRLHRDGFYARLDVAIADSPAWISLQANQDRPRLSREPEFRDLKVESRGIPLTLSWRIAR